MPEGGIGAQDPRRVRSRAAMLSAAMRLLEAHGPTAVTPARVATESGVHRATVYRHWPDADRLLVAVMAEADLPFFREPATPIRDWLRVRLREFADDLATPESRGVAATLMHAAVWRPEIATRRDALVDTLERRLAAALDLAVKSGELERRPDPTAVAAGLVGPLLYRGLFKAVPVGEAEIDEIIERTLGPGLR